MSEEALRDLKDKFNWQDRLCWECRMNLTEEDLKYRELRSWIHCHHEPKEKETTEQHYQRSRKELKKNAEQILKNLAEEDKEKPKPQCWCKGIGGERAFTLTDRTIDDLVFVKFCPECGKKL